MKEHLVRPQGITKTKQSSSRPGSDHIVWILDLYPSFTKLFRFIIIRLGDVYSTSSNVSSLIGKGYLYTHGLI